MKPKESAPQSPEAVTPKADASDPAADSKAAAEPQPDYYAQLLRLKADFENFRRRSDKEKSEFFRLGKSELLLRLLPLYDLLRKAHEQIAVQHAESELSKGMDGIFKEFEKIFKEEGVSPMDVVGKPYDPRFHEVLGAVDRPGVEDGVVVDVLQDGFMIKDQVLRTAKVRIAKKAAQPSNKEES